jgi:hypothetical protein
MRTRQVLETAIPEKDSLPTECETRMASVELQSVKERHLARQPEKLVYKPPGYYSKQRVKVSEPLGFAAKAAEQSLPTQALSSFPDPDIKNTLYFGKLAPNLSISELLNHINGGTLQEVSICPEGGHNSCYITFTDPEIAQAIYHDFSSHPLTILGWESRVRWANPPPRLSIDSIPNASRNLILNQLREQETNESLRKTFSEFGKIDCIRIAPDRSMASIHLCSIYSAISAKKNLEPEFDIEFGFDRCLDQRSAGTWMESKGDGNRTVFIGGITSEISYKDICDVSYDLNPFRLFEAEHYSIRNTFRKIIPVL